MNAWQDYLLTAIVQVTVICVAALTLAWCSRRRATRTHLVGVLGILLILGAPLLAVALPAQTWWRLSNTSQEPAEVVRRPIAIALPPREAERVRLSSSDSQRPTKVVLPDQNAEMVFTSELKAPVKGETEPAPRSAPVKPRFDWNRITLFGLGLWLAGALAAGTRWLYQQWRIRGLLRNLSATKAINRDQAGRLEATASEVCAAVGLRELPLIAISSVIPMPLVLGIRRPIIVVPQDLLEAGCEATLRDVLIHEAAHIVRHDAWVSIAQRLAGVLWWWHPGVALLNRVVNRSREEICDNFVLGRGDAATYAQTLLDLTERCSQVSRVVPSLGLLESRWTLESRITGLLKPGRDVMTRASGRIVALVAVLFSALCLLIGGIRAVEKDQEAKSAKALPAEAVAKADLKLHKVIVRGTCVDDEGQPLAGVRIIVLRRSPDYSREFTAGETKSDATGHFELQDVATALPDHGDLVAAAALKGYASACVHLPKPEQGVITKEIELGSNPGNLSGVVRDVEGRPIPGVTVYLPCIEEPIPGIFSAVTDEQGRYAITDLKRWTPESTKTFDPKTGTGTMTSACNFWLKHPDYPKSTAQNTGIPQEVDVTLHPAAVVEGEVLDQVTGRKAAGVTVSAQGVARSGWYQTTTDAEGRYRLRMTRDHYNIWAEADDRIAIAVKAIKAERGKTASGADIRLVRGGFVVGTVFGHDGKPITPAKAPPSQVAHYGPARPRTGAAVASTLVQPDGTYRLRVAPGLNYVYFMSGSGSLESVTVEDGQEVTFDLHLGENQRYRAEDLDNRLARKIRGAAEQEDAAENTLSAVNPGATSPFPTPAPRTRAETPTGKLLDELAEQNASNDHFHDVWAQTMKEIVELGPAAVPDLIAELDATNDDLMLRCLGFMLRAIGDKRAVPALIRAIPKTLRAPRSDMGLRSEQDEIAAFMQRHDLSPHKAGRDYSFGRPVREIFGALQSLTGKSFHEDQIFGIFEMGTPAQQELKRELYFRTARIWADWWEANWSAYLQDAAYSRVNLPAPARAAQAIPKIVPGQHFKTNGGSSNSLLEAYTNPQARYVFHDLDTGRYAGLPEKWRQAESIVEHFEEIEEWAAQEGFDLMGIQEIPEDDSRPYCALRAIGLEAWELGNERWKAGLVDTTFEALKAEGTPASELLLHQNRTKNRTEPEEIATFLFRTREGTAGLLFVGVDVHDDTQKPGDNFSGDSELNPVSFRKGRRFAWTQLEPLPQKPSR